MGTIVLTENSEHIRVADDYLHTLGRAIYNFAYLEWGIVWLAETVEPGFLTDASQLTAGQIARRFSESIERLPSTVQDKDQLRAVAASFRELLPARDGLVHGNPYLITYGVPWKGTVPQRVRNPPGKLSLQPVAIGADDGGNDIVRSTSVERVA